MAWRVTKVSVPQEADAVELVHLRSATEPPIPSTTFQTPPAASKGDLLLRELRFLHRPQPSQGNHSRENLIQTGSTFKKETTSSPFAAPVLENGAEETHDFREVES